jgi:hypothetical protein
MQRPSTTLVYTHHAQYLVRLIRCRATLSEDDSFEIFPLRGGARDLEPFRATLVKGQTVEVYAEVYIGGVGGCYLFGHPDGMTYEDLGRWMPHLVPAVAPLRDDLPQRMLCLGNHRLAALEEHLEPHDRPIYGAIVADPDNGYPIVRLNPHSFVFEASIEHLRLGHQGGVRSGVPWTPVHVIDMAQLIVPISAEEIIGYAGHHAS